jgi:oxygen-independent coproporphyrinogen-3 oxidase
VNLYVHFPFCRSKCAYCALHSRSGSSVADRDEYVRGIVRELKDFFGANSGKSLSTLYFGGGTPSYCDLRPVLDFLGVHKGGIETAEDFEFTVEVNPADVTPDLLAVLKCGGVNRLSMGVQSFDDAVLSSMKRAHNARRAREAWKMVRDAGFTNAGFDLICGWPDVSRGAWERTLETAVALAPDHCSVYTLIREPDTPLSCDVEQGRFELPSDDRALAELEAARCALLSAGLERYEISNFSRPGFECRHNLAVWHGEDYTGIGEGACSREGNDVSRVIFRLRLLKEGFNPHAAADDFPSLAPRVPEWTDTLERFAEEGLLHKIPSFPDVGFSYVLTPRGTEICDTILAELV